MADAARSLRRRAGVAGTDDRLETGVVAAGGGVLTLLAALITLEGSDSHLDWLQALGRAFMVAAPIAVGLYARQRERTRRFGGLLLAAGALAFLTTLAESPDSVPYTIGRTVAWLGEVLLVYLILTFPTGRLQTRTDRALVAAVAGVAIVLFLPTALLVEEFPLPNPWTSCLEACPPNALMVVASEPAWVGDVVVPVREALTVLVFFAVTLRLAGRWRGASRLLRLTLSPVLAVAALRCLAFCSAIVARRVTEGDVVVAGTWAIALSLPLMALAFVVGLARWRMFDAAAMRRLAARLRAGAGPDELREGLAEAFGDPTLQIAYRLDDDRGWSDAAGRPVRELEPGPDRCVTLIRDGDRIVAALLHDSALRDDRAFVDSATAYALMTLDNQRLAAQASFLVREIDESRARIQRTADEERRRIERDLHDGAQQRLVALRIQLELAAERLDRGGDGDRDDGEAGNLRALGAEVERALDEVRSLARGIYPAPLADRGVAEALRSAALQSPLPVTVLAPGPVRRHPAEVESAAYFCCLEALQNAAKHATGATAVVIEVHDGDDELRVEVRDDGAGFDAQQVSGGMGMTSMRDRLGAVGGSVAIVSSPGHGTRVVGRIPVTVRDPALPG